MNNTSQASKRQILKSTGIVGTSQVLTIILQIVRTKIIAVLLGPVGVGLLGIYNTIVDMVRNLTGLGINFSGVREIAQVVSNQNNQLAAQKALLLKRWAVITGLIGGVLLILLCVPISNFSFGDSSYSISVALLSLAVLFTSLNQSQIALLQGARRFAYMAKASVIGVALSIVIVTPIYYFIGIKGMIAAIVLMSISAFLLSQYFVSKLHLPQATLSIKDTFTSGKEMIKIGIASSISSIVTMFTMFLIRSFINNNGTLDDAGFFQASWTISNVYLLSVLNAMAADYFPRLSAVHNDNNKVNELVNEQTEIALIIGGSLVVAMLVFSELIIGILYSTKFSMSVVLLMFFAFGSAFKLVSWPMGYIPAAKGAIKQILVSEISWNIIFASLSYLLWERYKLVGIGISYIVSYIFYVGLVFVLVNKLSHFRWSKTNYRHMLFFLSMSVSTFLSIYMLDVNNLIRSTFLVVSVVYTFVYLNKIINFHVLIEKLFKQK